MVNSEGHVGKTIYLNNDMNVCMYLFICLSVLSQFTSLLRSFSSYETGQSVGGAKTGET